MERFVTAMLDPGQAQTRRRASLGCAAALALGLGACSGLNLDRLSSNAPPSASPPPAATTLGTGQVGAGLVLPLSAGGGIGVAAQSMRNAAELALAEFNAPTVQLIVKDDAGNVLGAQQATRAALAERGEIILGPVLGQSVAAAGQVARTRNVPVIGFSNDATAAGRGVFLLSFLPENEVNRVVDYAVSRGKRSFAALIADNPYGNVVDGAFRQAVARHNARIVASERVSTGALATQEPIQRVAAALEQADALFIPGDPESVVPIAQALATAGVNFKRLQLLGTGLWDDQRVYTESALQNGWFAAVDSSGFRGFSTRYRAKFGEDPVRTATLAYDAVSLAAALVKTQGNQRFTEQVLTSPSGFQGIDGIFRFRSDGTSERGLAVMRVTPSGPQPVSPAPKAFPGQT